MRYTGTYGSLGADTATAPPKVSFSLGEITKMPGQILETIRFIDQLPAIWPKGLTKFPTEDTLRLLGLLTSLSLSLGESIQKARLDVRQQIFNSEALDRVQTGLTRAVVQNLRKYQNVLVANKRAGVPVTTLPVTFRDDVIKAIIEIRSAMFVLPEIVKNIPGLASTILVGVFTVTGMAMADTVKGAFALVLNGAAYLAGLVPPLLNALLPSWLKVAAVGLAAYFIIRATR